MGYDNSVHAVLVIKVVIKLLKVGLPITFLFDLLAVIIEVKRCGAYLQFLQELLSDYQRGT